MNINQNTKTRELQIFLVERFLAALLFIYIGQQLTSLIYQNVFLPLVVDVMEAGTVTSAEGVLTSAFRMLLILILHFAERNLPAMGQDVLENFAESQFDMYLHVPSYIQRYGTTMIRLYDTALLLMIILMIILSILPHILSGWWYIHCISVKMEELREYDAEQKAENDRRRNLLFSDIVHDVKTPITTVTGYSRALMDGLVNDPDKEQEYLQAIHAKSMRISDLITMLFEFVKLDSEGFTLHQEKYDLAELCRENVIMHFSDFEDKGLELDIDIPDSKCMAFVDRIQMSRVVTNLLTNTIRYLQPEDRVFVSLEKITNEASRDYGMYKISVMDSGIPIEESLIDNIFDPFTRADSARNTVSGGSGLGLSIAHKIADMHGGRLSLNQPCGDGYTKAFEIYVPELKEKVVGEE